MQLSPAKLDVLILSGAFDVLGKYAQAELRRTVEKRAIDRHS